MSKIIALALFIGIIPGAALSAEEQGALICRGVVVDVATAEVADEAGAPDVYVSAGEGAKAETGGVFDIYRMKKVAAGTGEAEVRLYVGRLQLISVQGNIWIGRIISLAQRDSFPHVRYETVMVGDCLLSEPPAPAPQQSERAIKPDTPTAASPSDTRETPEGANSSKAGAPDIRSMYDIIPPKVLFDFDSARVKPEWQERLIEIADVIVSQHPAKVRVEGHADSIGTEEYNAALSRRRAQAVIDFLAQTRKLKPELFEIESFGETRPEATNENEAGRQQNRRVRIDVLEEIAPKDETSGKDDLPKGFDALAPERVDFPIFSSSGT